MYRATKTKADLFRERGVGCVILRELHPGAGLSVFTRRAGLGQNEAMEKARKVR